jgi:hypothetical protein
MDTYAVKLTFEEPLLGTVALNKEVFGDYVRNANTGEDELETLPVDEQIEKGSTGFHRVDGAPILYDYVIKGFFKDACSMLRRSKGSGSAKLTAFRKVIDGLVFIGPRRIPIALTGPIEWLERPLRAQTAQGERIALARSEMAPVGSSIEFMVKVLGEVPQDLLEEWLTYGGLRGLGQWRNAGYGRFSYELAKR